MIGTEFKNWCLWCPYGCGKRVEKKNTISRYVYKYQCLICKRNFIRSKNNELHEIPILVIENER